MLGLGRKSIAAIAVIGILLTSAGAVVATATPDNTAGDDTTNLRGWRSNGENAAIFFENRLQIVNGKIIQLQDNIAAAPENQPGLKAAQRQVDLAINFRDNAIQAYNSGNDNGAIKLLLVAWVHLRNAQKILNRGTLAKERREWKDQCKQLKQEFRDKAKDLRDNYRQSLNQLKEDWKQLRQDLRNNRLGGD